MTYKEFFTADKGIFTQIFKVNFPEQYQTIFGDTDPKILDNMALLKYGARTVISYLTPENYNDMIIAIITVNIDNWCRYAKAMQTEYDFLKPLKSETTRTENHTEDITDSRTNTEADKAFNDVDFSDDNRQTRQGTENRTQENNITETVSGIGVNKSYPDEIKKEIELSFNIWKENIIFALIKEITISIYV